MGLMDNIRNIFSNSKNKENTPIYENEEYLKSKLAGKILDLVNNIKRINSFDSSIWNLANISSYELQRKSLDELKSLQSTLEYRILELEGQKQSKNIKNEELEAAKWTGKKPNYMSDHDFDRFQRAEDR